MNTEPIKEYVIERLSEGVDMTDIGNELATAMADAFNDYQKSKEAQIQAFSKAIEPLYSYLKMYYPELTTTKLTESKVIDALTKDFLPALSKSASVIDQFLREHNL